MPLVVASLHVKDGDLANDFEREGQHSEDREGVERQLAQYAFMREEREREIRLLLRDVPADEIARAFLSSGAALLSISGDRAGVRAPSQDAPHEATYGENTGEQPITPRKRRRGARTAHPRGEIVLRYFYAIGDIIYTVNIITSTGVARSISRYYPVSALSERELQERIGVVFTSAEQWAPGT